MPMSRTRRAGTVARSTLGLAPTVAFPALAAAASSTKTYTSSAGDQWGNVTVTIKVAGKTIKSVSASSTYHTGRSMQIDQYALPTLQREALAAHSANIQSVSGATYTSGAFVAALRADRQRAHL